MPDIEAAFRLADDIAYDWIGRKGSDFVQDRRYGFGLELIVPAGELDRPEVLDHRVFDVGQDLIAELLIRQDAGDIEHGRIRIIQ